MKGKRVYVLSQGSYGGRNSYIWAVAETKKEAKQFCKEHGYKWNSNDQLFNRDSDATWISVEILVIGKVDGGKEVSYGVTKEQRERQKSYKETWL